MGERLIGLERIAKKANGSLVLEGLALELYAGEAVGIVGSNGSGKSTLLKIVSGMCAFDEGNRVADRKLKIGYAPERFPRLNFRAVEYLRAMGRMQGIRTEALSEYADGMLRRFGLDPDERKTMKHYSKGMLQKVNLIQALLGEPELLLLDEPFSGLDREAQDELTGLLTESKGQGQAILLTSHEPSLLERVADRALVLKDRRLEPTALHRAGNGASRRKRIVFEMARSDAINVPRVAELQQLRADGRTFVAYVEASRCDEALMKLLAEGASIREVADEREEAAS